MATREPTPVAGEHPISTGTAELVPDPYFDGGWTLNVNGVPSSHIVVGRPDVLAFEYMEWIATFVEPWVSAHVDPDRLRVTHLGGAGCSLPRYFAQLWPGSRHTVVELDARLAEQVRTWFDIPRSPTVKIRVGDARSVVDGLHPDSRDIVIRDVFAGAVTPNELTTQEFFAAVHASLASGGLYVANCGDYSDLRGAKAELAGMAEVFAHLAVVADPPMLKGRRYGNIILLGSDSPLPVEGTPEATQLTAKLLRGAVTAQYKDETWTRRFCAGAAGRRDAEHSRLAE